MGREIKFRAYHFGADYSVRPEMLYDSKLGDVLRWKQEGQDLSNVMQYTGLKDKNGVEIYEGDILHLGNTLSVVEYRISQFVRKEISQDLHPHVLEFEAYQQSISSEVIGNIYENPDMIK